MIVYSCKSLNLNQSAGVFSLWGKQFTVLELYGLFNCFFFPSLVSSRELLKTLGITEEGGRTETLTDPGLGGCMLSCPRLEEEHLY